MVDEILDGISIKLNQVFGEDYEIYADTDVVQGLKEPCFFISVLQSVQTAQLGTRFFRKYPFVVQYFPENDGCNSELHRVGTELFTVLEYITLPDTWALRGTDMNYETVDGVLQFKVVYTVFFRIEELKDKIETVSVFTGTEKQKGGTQVL